MLTIHNPRVTPAPKLTRRLLKALRAALAIVEATPRGGDLPDEDDLGPEDPTDADFERATAWVLAQLARRK